MRFDIRHVTVYDWGAPVPFADCRLRLTPIERRRQRVHVSRLDIEPKPDFVQDELDFFGNHVTRIAFRAPHSRLTLRATASVTIEPTPEVPPGTSPGWEEIRSRAALSRTLDADDPVQFLFPSRHVLLTPAVTAWAAEDFPEGRAIFDAVLALTKRIHRDFDYAPGVTDVATPLARVFAEKRGVCQDFAHVMIAGLRGLGLPAAYVGGYLRTLPPPGKPRLEGADAMHAWVEAWCGPVLGWIGFDPTNGIVASDEHIVVGFGRDYADTAPVVGVLSTTGDQGLSVAVDVIESPDPSAARPDETRNPAAPGSALEGRATSAP
ncbi:MAG: transglutaminase family protein [Siculibacillus sp.]